MTDDYVDDDEYNEEKVEALMAEMAKNIEAEIGPKRAYAASGSSATTSICFRHFTFS
jgi:hypothetical protein